MPFAIQRPGQFGDDSAHPSHWGRLSLLRCMPPVRALVRLLIRIAPSVALVFAATYGLLLLAPLNPMTAGFTYLVAILLIATKGGYVESSVASVIAMLCLNFYFLPPVGTFTISDPQNWVALFAFLVTSLTASQLSARVKRRALESEQRRAEVERLYALSRSLLLIDPSQPVARQFAQQIAQVCDFPGVALYIRGSGELYLTGFDESVVGAMLRDSALRSVLLKDEERNLITVPIRLGGEPIGSLAIPAGAFSDAALQSLLNLLAIGLERANAQKAVNQAEVARQSEELKSTLLDAIAHEFKTPLTSIKAVTTDLLSGSQGDLPMQQHELLTIVDESADRLSKLVTEAIQLAKIEGGAFKLNLGVHFPRSLINAAIRQMKSVLEGRTIEVQAPDDLPPVEVDSGLIQIVLTHLLDNAHKYSAPDTPITIGARMSEGRIVFYVTDHGPGIPDADRQRIFEKFYRGSHERHLRGAGMGLAIVREILAAHCEDIVLASTPGQGTEFSFALPIAPEGTSE